jgi:hypothetical protein
MLTPSSSTLHILISTEQSICILNRRLERICVCSYWWNVIGSFTCSARVLSCVPPSLRAALFGSLLFERVVGLTRKISAYNQMFW